MKVLSLTAIFVGAAALEGEVTAAGPPPPEVKVVPDWDKLTDFTTSFKVDYQPLIDAAAAQHELAPYTKLKESGKIQLDYLGERVKFSVDDWSVGYHNNGLVPPLLRGVSGTGNAEMTFDATAGTVGLRETGKMNTKVGPVSFEICTKVSFPKGLLPPKQILSAQLNQMKPRVDQMLSQFPNTKTTVDGNTVALYSKGAGKGYAGIQQDATPVGFGLSPPSGGKWGDAILEFSDWTEGAGSIVTKGCGTHMSATELLASPHSNHTLEMFDRLMDSLKKSEALSEVLTHFPEKPSAIFVGAAALEGEVTAFGPPPPEVKVVPDWDKLTDFTTSFKVDLQPLIDAAAAQHEPAPYTKLKESGKIQLDYLGERVKFSVDDWSVGYPNTNRVPPLLRGVSGTGNGEMTFDATAGTVGLRETGKMNTKVGPVSFEICTKVSFPKGLLPPKQILSAQLDQDKPRIDQMLSQFPNTKTTVDGNTVALYSKGAGKGYAGIQQDATPVGFGLSPPSGGKWGDAIVEFSDWTEGAGSIVTKGCGMHMSATELLASPHSNHTLEMFDRLMDSMKKSEALSEVLAYFPEKPSAIFVSAAALEGEVSPPMVANMDVNVHTPTWSWALVAAAAAAGAISAAVVLAVFQSRRRDRTDAYVAMSA